MTEPITELKAEIHNEIFENLRVCDEKILEKFEVSSFGDPTREFKVILRRTK